jgi:PilZ domain-containing protein
LAKSFHSESSESAIGNGPSSTYPQNTDRRRSERVFLTLPIRISEVREHNEVFLEGHTVDVSQHGATIMLDRKITVGQNIKVKRVGLDKEAIARVVAHKPRQSDSYLHGIALDDCNANPWGIVFPTTPEIAKAVLRALLRCIACEQLEVVYLNEFESVLFLNHCSVARLCERCNGWTTWARPLGWSPANPDYPALENRQMTSPPFPAPRWQDRRSHDRIRADVVACVRHPALGSEVVLVADLARGGSSFYSAANYLDGDRVEMAVPYTSKAPNIFLPARIVGSRKGNGKGLTEYRIAYLR